MRARIFNIFVNSTSRIKYGYIDTAKFRDDTTAYIKRYISVPMMTVRIFNDDDKLGDEIKMFASPEVVLKYTQIDLFKILKEHYELGMTYEFYVKTLSFSSWDIDFEIQRGEYPYLWDLVGLYDNRDELSAPIVEYPQVLNMYKTDEKF